MKAFVDGLQVLKGGQGKATVYIEKADMPTALDLNEQTVEMMLATPQEPQEPLSRDALLERYWKARRDQDAAFNALMALSEQKISGGAQEVQVHLPEPEPQAEGACTG